MGNEPDLRLFFDRLSFLLKVKNFEFSNIMIAPFITVHIKDTILPGRSKGAAGGS
ncbi:hypothetical protein HMPREF0494_0194 [Limosilactobacillus antri DSM 16041]|uniref:Uncharacterized protein n=1 Tax=Limosilactobacillus antri DSM 16041 TaxID=525309 RepID=C8P4F0_9LACO|nr:hypothetical protein HMPREF0494_0194 [Limosilactobacillus antri DSM 16041]